MPDLKEHIRQKTNDFNRNRRQIAELYERAALPIEKGGMALRNIGSVSLAAFACSLVASSKKFG